MQALNRDSKTSVYFGVSFMVAMPWMVDKISAVGLQKALLDSGLDFTETSIRTGSFRLVRQQPSNLQVKLESPAPQVSGIHIVAQQPQYDLEMFGKDAAAVIDAFCLSFPAQQYQVIQSSAKIQHLYSCHEHAFKYLWEARLGQSAADFQVLGRRPVAGGGLRLLMPPHAVGDEEPRSIEIRVESFLQEPRKLLIETFFVWPRPRVVGESEKFDPAGLLGAVEQYAAAAVWDFLVGSKGTRAQGEF